MIVPVEGQHQRYLRRRHPSGMTMRTHGCWADSYAPAGYCSRPWEAHSLMEPKLKDCTVGYTMVPLATNELMLPRREGGKCPVRNASLRVACLEIWMAPATALRNFDGRPLTLAGSRAGDRCVMALTLFGFAHAEVSVDMSQRRRYVRSSRKEVRTEG